MKVCTLFFSSKTMRVGKFCNKWCKGILDLSGSNWGKLCEGVAGEFWSSLQSRCETVSVIHQISLVVLYLFLKKKIGICWVSYLMFTQKWILICSILGCTTAESGRWVPVFWRILLPPFSDEGSSLWPTKMPVDFYWTTWYCCLKRSQFKDKVE